MYAGYWFGERPAIAFCEEWKEGPRPIGEACQWCGEPIGLTDNGVVQGQVQFNQDEATVTESGFTIVSGTMKNVPYHLECFIRQGVGGVHHLLGNCACCGGSMQPDPVGMTKRAAAIAASEQWWKGEVGGGLRAN